MNAIAAMAIRCRQTWLRVPTAAPHQLEHGQIVSLKCKFGSVACLHELSKYIPQSLPPSYAVPIEGLARLRSPAVPRMASPSLCIVSTCRCDGASRASWMGGRGSSTRRSHPLKALQNHRGHMLCCSCSSAWFELFRHCCPFSGMVSGMPAAAA
jgi:hypothetical protein